MSTGGGPAVTVFSIVAHVVGLRMPREMMTAALLATTMDVELWSVVSDAQRRDRGSRGFRMDARPKRLRRRELVEKSWCYTRHRPAAATFVECSAHADAPRCSWSR